MSPFNIVLPKCENHYKTNLSALAGIIWDSGAASITDCHVFVDPGITKPNSKNHSVNGDVT